MDSHPDGFRQRDRHDQGRGLAQNGQTTPIEGRTDPKGWIQIDGLHRLEAMKALGEATIKSYIVQARKF